MLVALVSALLSVILVAWSLPTIGLLLGSCRARSSWPPAVSSGRRRASLFFLVPAHNESVLIADCVASIMAQEAEKCIVRTLVVADNCSDDTGLIAKNAGAEVLERNDPTQLGKPAAVAWALVKSQLDGIDAIVILDADSVIEPGFADALAGLDGLSDIAVQARFGVANPSESWLTRLASLWVNVRFDRQFMRKQAMGLNVVLAGNGMCLGTRWLQRAGWSSSGLTEDLDLYARSTLRGMPIRFLPTARLVAQEARGLGQGVVQRKRWQAGRWEALRAEGLAIISSPWIGWAQKVDTIAELMLPGPVVFVAVALLCASGLLVAGGIPASILAAGFIVSTLPLAYDTLAAMRGRADRVQLVVALLMLPLYASWRVGLSLLGVILPGEDVWRRTPRHAPPPG